MKLIVTNINNIKLILILILISKKDLGKLCKQENEPAGRYVKKYVIKLYVIIWSPILCLEVSIERKS